MSFTRLPAPTFSIDRPDGRDLLLRERRLWDRLLQDLIGYLREALQALARKNDAPNREAQNQAQAADGASDKSPGQPKVSLQ
ncbi:MAG: hypothetical protein NTAFB05_25010 [Nitrobacter sp.]|uniref:hypothetical protein n=1 Tax=Nitrobacter sp. TaxID=29420 RepID=UPI00387DF0AE